MAGLQNRPLRWITPTGLPCAGRYYESRTKTLDRKLLGVRVQRSVGIGYKSTIVIANARTAAAANFVHSLDASHLIMIANECVREHITELAFVHDCFGCLAPHANKVNEIIRKQFVRLYEENDPLKKLRDRMLLDGKLLLGERPKYGDLNLREMLMGDNYLVH
jgi:DNA-directed RNA polymerase